MPVSLTFEIEGMAELASALARIPRSVRKKSSRLMRNQATKILVREWRRMLSRGGSRNRVARRTGALYRSIKPGSPSATRALVYSDSPYAAIHEFGGKTRAHVIRPRSANVLSFFWPKVGHQVFFEKVNHPGSVMLEKPHRDPAARIAFPKIVARYRKMLDEAVQEVTKEAKRAKR